MPPSNPIHQPKMSASQRRLMDIQAKHDEDIQGIMQAAAIYQRCLWLLIERAGGAPIEIDSSKIDPLWELKFENPDEKQLNFFRITAQKIPAPTDEQISQIAQELVGTSEHPKEAMDRAGCPNVPYVYMIALMAPKILPIGGKWVDRTAFDALPEETKQRLAATPPTHG